MIKTRFLAVLSSFLMLTACGSYSEDSSAVNVQGESSSVMIGKFDFENKTVLLNSGYHTI